MTLPFENDTRAITRKLALRSLQSEKRRNRMVVLAVALAACLICFSTVLSFSLWETKRNHVEDTYEAVYLQVTEADVQALRGLEELARVGEYYLLGMEPARQGYTASYLYCDPETLYIARDQMHLVEGQLPQRGDEVAASRYFLSRYGGSAKLGEKIRLDSESFSGEYTLTGILEGYQEDKVNGCTFLLSKETLKGWSGYDPAGYRAYVHFRQEAEMTEAQLTARSREIAEEYQLEIPVLNSAYLRFYKEPPAASVLGLAAGVAALVLIGGHVVIQSIFRISIQDKIQSYGQLRTLGATADQIRRIVRTEGRRLGWTGIGLGILLGWGLGFAFFSRVFRPVFYLGSAGSTALLCWAMVAVSIRRPVRAAAQVSPIEAVRFQIRSGPQTPSRQKARRLTPFSLGVANFARDRKKTLSIVASLSLGGVLLLVAASVLLVRSPERIARRYFPAGDLRIYLDSDRTEYELMARGNPLSDALRQEILSMDGVAEVVTGRQSLHVRMDGPRNSSAGMCDMLTPQNQAQVQDTLLEGRLPQGPQEVLIASSHLEDLVDTGIGSPLTLRIGDQTRTARIVGIFNEHSLPNGHGPLALDGVCLIADPALFRQVLPENRNFDYSWSIRTDPAQTLQVENRLNTLLSAHPDLSLDTLEIHIAYEEMENRVVFGGVQALSWLIFLFGVVNLINTTLSNQMSRRRENSILRAVGLTQGQLCQMTLWEGVCYALTASLATLAAGLPLAILAARKFSQMTFNGEALPYVFPGVQMGLFVLVLFGLEILLSFWTLHRQKGLSLVEQMRRAE